MGGTEYKVTAYRHWTLGGIKKALQALTGVPTRKQRLVLGTTALLDDSQPITELVRLAASGSEVEARAGPAPKEESWASAMRIGWTTGTKGRAPLASEGGRLELTLVRRTSQQAIWMHRVGRLGMMLCDVPSELKSDRELVLMAVKHNKEAFQFADASLQADRSFVLAAVRVNASVLPYVSRVFRADRDIVLAAVSRRGEVLACVGPEFRSDPEVVLTAVKQHGLALRYACEGLRTDRSLAIAAAERNAGAVAYVGEALRCDQEAWSAVLMAALRSNMYSLEEAHEQRLVDEAELFEPEIDILFDF